MELIRHGIRNLLRQRRRTLLTVFSIAVGVASVLITAFVGEAGKQMVNAELREMGMDGLLIAKPAQARPFGEAELELLKNQPSVLQVKPMISQYSQVKMHGLVAKTLLWGIDWGEEQILSLDLRYGRLLHRGDLANRERVCIVDIRTAQAFYQRENIVGKTVWVQIGGRYHPLQVVGVAASGGTMVQSFSKAGLPNLVYLPYTTLQQLSGVAGTEKVAVRLAEPSSEEEIVEKLSAFTGVDGYRADNMTQYREQFNRIIAVVAVVLSVVAAVSLVVAGLGVMTIMLMAVKERTREIGIKKAVGADRWTILREFLLEAIFLSSAGCVLGSLLGVAVVWMGEHIFHLPITAEPRFVAVVCLVTVMMGSLFGVYPSWLASHLLPVQALRER